MKKTFSALLNWDTFYIVLVALLLGMILGVAFNSKYSIPIRIRLHNLYLKINPDVQKDSQTLIIDKVTKDAPISSQTNIFEEPKQNKNNFLYCIKKIFIKNDKKPQTIHDVIIN